jgi:thioredoxin reductase (NADPH)
MADWDVVVIGGGAAGLSAAAAAAEAGLRCLVLDRMGGGGELMNFTHRLHGVEEGVTGPDLAATLLEQAMGAGAELGIAEVTGLAREGEGWAIATDDEGHTARAVILAVGLAPGTLGLPEEAAFEGQGLSHCAACDGPLYRGQPVVVAGHDRWAVEEARELLGTAASVTLATQGGDPAADAAGVAVVPGRVSALEGAAGLDAVVVQVASGESRRLPARAVFVLTGRRPALGFAPAALARDDAGRLVTDAALRCSIPGLHAAGDARSGAERTLAAATAEGRRAVAALTPLGKGAASG